MLHHMLRAAAQRAFNVLDPYFQYVTMLLHGDGTNGAQNNTFLDSSTNNFTITRNGNTTQGTFSPYGSNWSNYFGGSDYITLSSAPISATGAFTFECWVFVTGTAASQCVYGQYSSGDANRWMILWNDTANKFTFAVSGSTSYNSTNTYSANTWHHIAWVRDGSNNLSFYINGVRDSTNASVTTSLATVNPMIGNRGGGGTPYTGYISNMRITNTAVYSGTTYTVPTTPLTNISGTTLLTCQSNRFVDNETTAKTFTITGSPSVQRFSPFSPTSAYSTSVIGGSGYFDGSGDYLSVASNAAFDFGTSDFTIECFFNASSVSGVQMLATKQISGAIALQLRLNGSALEFVSRSSNGSGLVTLSGGTVIANSWNHAAIVKNSGTISLYLNGTSVSSSSSSNDLSGTTAFYVGVLNDPSLGNYFTGYISNLRVVKGSAVYTGNFTPSTSPLTAITNTSLLLSYTNAGIFDNAMMNDLETVGNAQISTSVKKYGTGSIAYDGSGDWLLTKGSPNFNFGGDFTFECWVYIAGNSSAQPTGGTRPAALMTITNTSGLPTGSFFSLNGTTTTTGTGFGVFYYVNGTEYGANCTVSISQNTWHHIAMCRSGSTVRLFLNGTSQTVTTYGSIGTINMDNQNYPVYIGANNFDTAQYGNRVLNGYIDDLRITKGYARYTSSFTAPTAAFPNN